MRLLVVDDHPLLRQGLLDLLGGLPDVESAAAVADGAEAAEAAVREDVDVVLMDLSMPGLDGLAATRAVLQVRPQARVVVLTTFAEHDRIRAALAAGAVGYLLKDAEPDQIVQAVRDAAAGYAPISPRAATALLPGAEDSAPGQQPAPASTAAPGGLALTPRETEVLALVATGLPNKSVARRMGISEKTVKAHLSRVFAAIGVTDRTSAALWAQRHGIGGSG